MLRRRIHYAFMKNTDLFTKSKISLSFRPYQQFHMLGINYDNKTWEYYKTGFNSFNCHSFFYVKAVSYIDTIFFSLFLWKTLQKKFFLIDEFNRITLI